ncbi:uncharacterized protein LOC127102378 [Lathyrus oleraceus]|uniref:uncharacterized protein LOC127102378 n=1 Tax=Pisum sativum TaxID=3888 RepID=UPI0021D306CF|nr:uncharacterized protein LOC127102378 [Pisum sativum]
MGVGHALKLKKLTPKFIGPYKIFQIIDVVACKVALPPDILNLHDMFHVSKFQKYIHDPSHVIRIDDMQVMDNLTVKALPVRIEDHKLKNLRGKEIALVNIVWGGVAGENMIWELEIRMRETYPELFASGRPLSVVHQPYKLELKVLRECEEKGRDMGVVGENIAGKNDGAIASAL